MSRILRNWLERWLVVMLLAHAVVVATVEAEQPDSIYFHDDYNKAIQEAKLTKKPLFLEFRCAP